MTDVLIATDAEWVHDDVVAAVGGPDVTVRWVRRGADVLPAVQDRVPDIAVLDLQIGNMGAMAVCLELRLEESADRLPHVPVLMLLDRIADVFLARRSQAEGWLVKPVDPIRLRRAVQAVLTGETYAERLPGVVTDLAATGPAAAPAPTGGTGAGVG